MEFDPDQRTAALSIGEFAAFTTGPRPPGEGGPQGVWRAQLGTRCHREMRERTAAVAPDAAFEVPVSGRIAHRGWLLRLEGRIDQLLPRPEGGHVVREIKTTLARLPLPEEQLREEHPDYVVQLGAYLALHRLADAATPLVGELVFVEPASGLSQTLVFNDGDRARFDAQLEAVAVFLEARRLARERLRALRWHPAFAALRPGQETIHGDLAAALARHPAVLLSAPTGYGKTGVILETALRLLRDGDVSRVLYLTGKSTGQLHVARTLSAMTAPDGAPAASDHPAALSVWQVRPKREHCVNTIFHCLREHCGYLHDLERRWARSGLARLALFPAESRDLEALRAAGRDAGVCPYEITRASLPHCDVWVGDFNYVFAPDNRSLFSEQPGFDPAQTLLVIDEAHNLPARVADSLSRELSATDLQLLLGELEQADAPSPLLRRLETLWRLCAHLPATDRLPLDTEDDLAAQLRDCADAAALHPPDFARLSPPAADLLWRLPSLAAWIDDDAMDKLLWSPAPGLVRLTCLDASAHIGATLRDYRRVLFATATPGPADLFAAACGLAENNLQTTTAEAPLAVLTAPTPWRDHAYDVAVDLRVDTTWKQRARHHADTADTLVRFHDVARAPVAVFFPSYAYAQAVLDAIDAAGAPLRCALQPRQSDLAAQSAWIDESLLLADALVFVLGGSFAEGIDLLGGRVGHAMVVGPALPEVNAVQRARTEASRAPRDETFRRVYLVPGLQKVNQALGRLVRAPGQRARVLLHCRRFADPAYASLLAPEYQHGRLLVTDADLADWLSASR